MGYVKHIIVVCVFFVIATEVSSVLANVQMSGVARETYGTGETGAFFFVGKEHIYADDLMRTKLGVPLQANRKQPESVESDKAVQNVTLEEVKVSKENKMLFGAVAQREPIKSEPVLRSKQKIRLKDTSTF